VVISLSERDPIALAVLGVLVLVAVFGRPLVNRKTS